MMSYESVMESLSPQGEAYSSEKARVEEKEVLANDPSFAQQRD